jgi:succinoglycan biosynthesis transport protein ExoP
MENLPTPHPKFVLGTERPSQVGYGQSAPGYGYPEALQADSSPDMQAGGLIEYWRMVRRRRGTLIVVAFLGVLAAILIAFTQTPVFRARTALEIQNINSDFLNAKQVNPVSEDGSGANTLTDVQTQMKIVQSEALVDKVVDHLSAAGELKPGQGESEFFSTWLKALRVPVNQQPDDRDYRLREKAMKSLTVRQLGQTRVIEVLYNSPDPKLAADFLNTLTSSYIESNMEARWQMSQRTGEWLSRQLDDMRVKLERSEDALQAYARRSGLLFTTPQSGAAEKTNVSEEKLRHVQEELSKAQADRAASQSRYETAKSAAPDSLADVLSDTSLRGLQDKLTELQRERAELIATYTAKHEKVRRVEAQMAPLETAFARERDAIIERIHNDYNTALGRERLLQADYASQSKIVTDQAEKSIQYSILKREVDSNRQLYESMLDQVRQASVASAIRASNIRVVDPAKVPHLPYSPDFLLNSALGLLSGLMVGVVVVILRERADRTLQQPGDMQYWTNVTELGAIPSAGAEIGRRIYYAARRKPLPGATPLGLNAAPGVNDPPAVIVVGTKKSEERVELMTWQRKPSPVAEAFRAVLTSIMFSGENGSRPHVLVLTSASPAEGKTTIVSNLGIALAEIRQRVLIIDADLRKPRMHELFDVSNERGLSDLLQQPPAVNGTLEAALRGIVQETSIPGLHVLPSGPSTHAAANLLYSPNLAAILKKFRQEFDMILVDTPPMLNIADARVAGRLADAVVFVARAGRTTREAAQAAHQRFAEDRTPILGTILNDWDPAKSPGGYYGNYGGSYYGGYKYSAYKS